MQSREQNKVPTVTEPEHPIHSCVTDYERGMQLIVDRLLATDYEFLGLLDAVTGYLMVFGENKDIDGMARNGTIYDEEMPRVFHGLLPEEYFEEGVRMMERSHVIRELADRSFFTCSFPARNLGLTRAGRKQWKFAYLDDSKTKILMTRTDITDVFNTERDALSGLYNRQAFYRHVREVLDANPQQRFVLIRCDIDRFKAYNDARGTQAGDCLLTEFGRAIRHKNWPELAVFGRIEADHFGALYPIEAFDVERWERMHAQWLNSAAKGYRLTSSIGIYEITDPQMEVSLMCDRALLALRTVKDSYAKKVAWYDETLRKRLIEEQELLEDMETALSEEQFVLYFQPQVNYVDGLIVGAEALVRWNHPTRGMLMPGEFIPVFEKNGFILSLDAYVWEKCCQYLRTWLDHDNEMAKIPVSVNISRYDIYDSTLCRRLYTLVEKYRLQPSMLRLEITESAYMQDPEQLIGVVRELRQMGFTVEMDDFGAGYSSLNTLKDVPVDVLKLDIRFLSDGVEDTRGGLILCSVIRMAHGLNLPVIAEGVESSTQADYLKGLSCFYMQGYHFGRPMPACEFESFVHGSEEDKSQQLAVCTQGAKSIFLHRLSREQLYDGLASEALSNQELGIMAEQSGRMVCRYYMKTHVLEWMNRPSHKRYGGTVIQENMPEYLVEQRIISPDTAEVYYNFFEQMNDGVASGSVNIKMKVEKEEYCWYHGSYSLVYREDGLPAYALITFAHNSEMQEKKQEIPEQVWISELV